MAGEVPGITNAAAHALLSRVVDEFAWLSDQALERIVDGGASSYIGPNLAFALLEARRFCEQWPSKAMERVFNAHAE